MSEPIDTEPGGQGDTAEPTRSELRLIRQALRQDWPIEPDLKAGILRRLCDYLDRQTLEGQTCSDRQVVSAARTLVEFMRLNIEQQQIDLARDKLDGRSATRSLTDLVGEAERRATDRKRDRQTDGPAG